MNKLLQLLLLSENSRYFLLSKVKKSKTGQLNKCTVLYLQIDIYYKGLSSLHECLMNDKTTELQNCNNI